MATYNTDDDKHINNSYCIPDYPLMLRTYNNMKYNRIYDHSTLSVTSKLCELNILNFDFWNTRNKMITDFYSNFNTTQNLEFYMAEYEKISIVEPRTRKLLLFTIKCRRLQDFAYMEINWLRKCMFIDCKNFQVWQAMNVFNNLYNIKPKNLVFFDKLIDFDSRNVHFWRFFVTYTKKTKNTAWVMQFTEMCISKDRTNNSAWSCRYNIFKDVIDAIVIEQELMYAISNCNARYNDAQIGYFFAFRNAFTFMEVCIRTVERVKDDHFKFLLIIYVIDKKLSDMYNLADTLYKKILYRKGPKFIYILQLLVSTGIKNIEF